MEIDYITFDEGSADPDENTRRLVEAIASARLGPLRADLEARCSTDAAH